VNFWELFWQNFLQAIFFEQCVDMDVLTAYRFVHFVSNWCSLQWSWDVAADV